MDQTLNRYKNKTSCTRCSEIYLYSICNVIHVLFNSLFLVKKIDRYFNGLDVTDNCCSLGDLTDDWIGKEVLQILKKANFKDIGSYNSTLDIFLDYVVF